jgi:hypothetical protein
MAEITREKVIDTLAQQVNHVGKELLRRVPDLQDATVSWLNQYMQGKLVVHVDTQDLSHQIDGLGANFSKLAAGLIITGMTIGTAIVTTQIWQTSRADAILPNIALGIFVVLLVVGARLIWGMLHPPRRPYVE